MKKILLVDFCSFNGHHESYFMKILTTLIDTEHYVFSYSTNNSKLAENIRIQNLQNCKVIDLELSVLDKIVRHLLLLLDRAIQALPLTRCLKPNSLCNLIAANRLIFQIGEQVPVFFAHIDSVLPAVPPFVASRFMPHAWSGIYIMPSYQSSIHIGRIKSIQRFFSEKNLTLGSCKSLLVLNPIYQKFFRKTCPSLRCFYLPELCSNELSDKSNTSSDLIWTIKEKAAGRTIISVLGTLSRRKNLLLFLETVNRLDSTRYFPVVVGQMRWNEYSEREAKRINELSKNLESNAFIKLDYRVPDEMKFARLICLSDIVYIQYKNHPFSSNILAKSIMYRKPVVVSPGYLMARTVRRYKWQVVSKENSNDLVEAIHFCTDQFQIDEECYQKFTTDHSEKKFYDAVLTAMAHLTTS